MTKTVSGPKISNKLLILVLVTIIGGIYLLNCLTPLRLTHDTVRYLRAAEWMEKGFPPEANAAKDFLPYGYSSEIFLLSKLHLLNTFVLSLINAFYLFGSLWFVLKIFRKSIKPLVFVLFVLLNWLAIKLVITPLSEMQYLFFSMGALYFFNQYRLNHNTRNALLTILFAVAAILTRTVGVAILIAIMFTQLTENPYWSRIGFWQKMKYVLAIVLGIAVIAFFLKELRITNYFHYFLRPFYRYGFVAYLRGLPYHMRDWAELFINTPGSKISFLAPSLKGTLFISIGIASLAALFFLLPTKKSNAPAVLKYYLVVYMIIVFNWPFFDSRFWFPVLPLVLAILLQPVDTSVFTRVLVLAAKSLYIIMGLFAIAYYTYTSFNRKALAIKQDAGIWRNEYEIHFFGRPLSDTVTQSKEEVIQMLNKIDSRNTEKRWVSASQAGQYFRI